MKLFDVKLGKMYCRILLQKTLWTDNTLRAK